LLRASALLAIGLLAQIWVDRALAPVEQADDQLLAAQPDATPRALVPVTLQQPISEVEIAAPRAASIDASASLGSVPGSAGGEDRHTVGTAGASLGRDPSAPSARRAGTSRSRSAGQASADAPVVRSDAAPDPVALETSAAGALLASLDALPSPMRQRRIAYSFEPARLGAEPLPVPAAAAPSGRPQHHDMITIRRVIQEYATAFGRLDSGAAKRVWPTIDEQALARAFNGLQSQSLTLDDCGVTITGAVAAQASCHGRATYLPKVGRQRPFSTTGEWTFSLARAGSAWVIQSAAVQ
jgi:hypothetical protein